MVRAALVAIVIVTQVANAQTGVRSDSANVAAALDAVRAFQGVWRQSWSAGLAQQVKRVDRFQGEIPKYFADLGTIKHFPRKPDLYCDFQGPVVYSDHAWGIPAKERRIASEANDRNWVCPNWLPPSDYYLSQAGLGDEGEWIDNALEPSFRGRINNERRALIQQLRATLSVVPTDSVLVGQYVRMLVDNREYAGAVSAAEQCSAVKSWCLALLGYVKHRMGHIAAADEAFRASLAALTETQRCAFTRIASLLDVATRKAYDRMSCAQQDSVNQTIWWLADPLWSVEGNDRLTEQYARKMTIALRSALGRDERYNWTRMGGGDALAEMIERYGWMSYAYAGPTMLPPIFPVTERGAYGGIPKNLEEKLAARRLGGVKTTYEYSIGRVHLVPPPAMVRDPFSITNDDWTLNAPAGTSWDYTFNWWPEEHYAPLHPLIKLREQQTGFLRRQDHALLAYGSALANTDIDRKLGDSVPAAIAVSTGPKSVNVAQRRRVGAQDRLTFLVPLPTAPALVSVEVPWETTGQRGARSRFAVKAPPPLSVMAAGDVDISDPLILAVPGGVTALPNLADSAVALMHGSTMLAAGSNEIGVYWETYGIGAGDTVEVTVSVQRKGATGIVDRVTSAVGGANSLVSASWMEPQPGQSVRNVAGAIPIQMRSVVLNISALPLGTYVLEIGVKKRGAGDLKSSREFTIR